MFAAPHVEGPPETDAVADIPQFAFAEQVRRPLPEDDCAERACKAIAELGYEGLRDEAVEAAGTPEDPATAWRRKLERDGKVRSEATTLADLMGAAEQHG